MILENRIVNARPVILYHATLVYKNTEVVLYAVYLFAQIYTCVRRVKQLQSLHKKRFDM